MRKSDNNRIARATGATIVNRVEDLREVDVGTGCGLFYIEKLGDECVSLSPPRSFSLSCRKRLTHTLLVFIGLGRYFTFLDECVAPKACTILLRGPSKDILSEIDRNLADAMAVARNVVFHPLLAPGGGATELAIASALLKEGRANEGADGEGMRAIADALEVIPRTLIQNCGGNAMRVLTDLRVRLRFPFLNTPLPSPSRSPHHSPLSVLY